MNTRQKLSLLPILGILSCVFFAFEKLRENSVYSSCQSNLKRVGLALKQYERDYDEKTVQSHNWKTVLEPYYRFYKDEPMFNCPDPKFGYAFNAYLSGVSEQQVGDFKNNQYKTTPTVFDSISTQINAADFGSSFPTNGAHPRLKKGRGNNVLFYDGHVEWLQTKPIFRALKPLAPPQPKAKSPVSSGKNARAR